MSFRALTSSGDWTFGNGVQNYLIDEDAINADIATALRLFLGECFFALDSGVDWWNLIGSHDEQNIILQCRKVIASRAGVARINTVYANLTRSTRQLSVTYNIDTIYSRSIVNTVTPA
jgi:hypothetical protein